MYRNREKDKIFSASGTFTLLSRNKIILFKLFRESKVNYTKPWKRQDFFSFRYISLWNLRWYAFPVWNAKNPPHLGALFWSLLEVSPMVGLMFIWSDSIALVVFWTETTDMATGEEDFPFPTAIKRSSRAQTSMFIRNVPEASQLITVGIWSNLRPMEFQLKLMNHVRLVVTPQLRFPLYSDG